MKIILLHSGEETMVSDEDFEFLSQWRWWKSSTGVCRKPKLAPRKPVYMHRIVASRMGLSLFGLEVDHKDHNPFNNQRENIRAATSSQNRFNSSLRRDNTSGFKGVIRHKHMWRSRIRKDGKDIHLGLFPSRREAAQAYNQAAIKYFGEFACLNDL